MTDKKFIKSLRDDLELIYSNLHIFDRNDLEVVVSGLAHIANEQLNAAKNRNKVLKNETKRKNREKENKMIEERECPEDYLERAKYILERLKFFYPQYKATRKFIEQTKKIKYFGIPPFEFWAIKRDFDLYNVLFRGELKEYKDIFVERYLNRLSLMDYGEKCFGERNATNKKRAENLNTKFLAELAKALELQDAADVQSDRIKIVNEDFEAYKLLKEIEKR